MIYSPAIDLSRQIDLSPLTTCWIIDPEPQEVAVYRFDQDPIEPVAKLSEQEEINSPLLPGLAVRLSEIFRPG